MSLSGFEATETGAMLPPPPFQMKAGTQAPAKQEGKGSGKLPGDLSNGFAKTAGHDLSDVNVHYNSAKPAQLGALAFAQGNEIHLGPGQETHLPHEAAHIVQQREGRVRANTEVGGQAVNDEKGLEHEADTLGAKAVQMKSIALGADEDVSGDGGGVSGTKFRQPVQGKFRSVGVAQMETPKIKDNGPEKYAGGKFDKSSGSYTVAKGLDGKGFDTLSGIARRFNVTVVDLKKKNPGLANEIQVGQKIQIPGEIVAKPKTEIEPTEKAIGESIAEGVNSLNTGHKHDAGVHYAHNYQANAKKYLKNPAGNALLKGYADFWKEEYWRGYANPKYFKRVGFMEWDLLPNVSASEAIQSWFNGLTIAECNTAIVVDMLNTMRKAIGDKKFDELYSSKYGVPQEKLMKISNKSRDTPLDGKLEKSASVKDAGTIGKRNVKKGEWHYFYNHPKYLIKHPGGAFQGENAIYMGDDGGQQMWAGLGVSPVTERKMMETMTSAYNSPRTERDYQRLLSRLRFKKSKNKTWKESYTINLKSIPDKYRHDKGKYPETISVKEILNAPEYTIRGKSRKGGFKASSGKRLSAKVIQGL